MTGGSAPSRSGPVTARGRGPDDGPHAPLVVNSAAQSREAAVKVWRFFQSQEFLGMLYQQALALPVTDGIMDQPGASRWAAPLQGILSHRSRIGLPALAADHGPIRSEYGVDGAALFRRPSKNAAVPADHRGRYSAGPGTGQRVSG